MNDRMFVKRVVLLCIVSFCFFLWNGTKETFAQTAIRIHSPQIENTQTSAIQYAVWHLSSAEDLAMSDADKEKLKQQTPEELTQRYGQAITMLDNVTRDDLATGSYYVRAVNTNQFLKEVAPFFFQVSRSEEVLRLITPKRVLPTGNLKVFKFTQQVNQRKPLAGVKFILYRDNEWQPLYFSNGVATTDSTAVSELSTDENGEIYVTGLLPGKYYLREVSTVPGYLLLHEDMEITIQEGQSTLQEVENYPIEDVPPYLPNTGTQTTEQLLAVLLVVGGVIVAMQGTTSKSKRVIEG